MTVSLGFLERCSADTGFQVSALEKVVRLGELAGDLARHPLLGPALALKGGTALNLCFVPPTRLSVDLDYNVVAHADREAMRENRPLVEAAVEDLARLRGYTVQRSADAFAGRKIHLAFSSVLVGMPGPPLLTLLVAMGSVGGIEIVCQGGGGCSWRRKRPATSMCG